MDNRVDRLIKIIRNSQPFFGPSKLNLNWEQTRFIAIGKGAGSLAKQMEPNLKTKGVVITKSGHGQASDSWTTCYGDHPYISQNSFKCALELINFLKTVKEDEHLLFGITGGASALVELPVSYFSQEEVALINEELVRSGADIGDINLLRKEVSQIKNGGLLTYCKSRNVTMLVISDVPYEGDMEVSLVGSSPVIYKEGSTAELEQVIKSFIDTTDLKEKLLRYIHSNSRKENNIKKQRAYEETHFDNYILSNHQKIIKESIIEFPDAKVEKRPFSTTYKDGIERTIIEMKRGGAGTYISCGEFNVEVQGSGLGGRNTHFVLCMAIELFDKNIMGEGDHFICSLGTDGTDGATKAAGAWITRDLYLKAINMNLDPIKYIQSFNSYVFFNKLGSLVVTGPTFNNLMDLRMISIS